MKQEYKELLLKDLCARLPYGVIIEVYGESQSVTEVLHNITDEGNIEISYTTVNVETIKPYLRPMSSMTEEERKEYYTLEHACYKQTDWLNAHHFDYRGLIEKSLAIVAPDNMYK